MSLINLKRLSIDALNSLAGNIIDELGTREDKVVSGDFVEQICAIETKEEMLIENLHLLESKKELIEDEIDRIKEALEELDNKESTLFYELDIGVVNIS